MKNTNTKNGQQDNSCYFCANNINYIDYKDVQLIGKYINTYKKILPVKRTHNCSKHQRMLATAIKRARIMALLPFVKGKR